VGVKTATAYEYLITLGLIGGRNRRVLDRREEVLRERRRGSSLPVLARAFGLGLTTVARDLVIGRGCPSMLEQPADLHYPQHLEPAARIRDVSSREVTVSAMWAARRRLVAEAWKPGRSISGLARELGFNRSQVRRCLVELGLLS
jgi:hypothetical protein